MERTGVEKDNGKLYYMKKSNINKTNYDKILVMTFLTSLNHDFWSLKGPRY